MKVVLRKEESGVTEVVGTILILAMTVVLFSTIIIWVSTIPTPAAQTRVDIQASLIPRYVTQGGGQVEQGDWVNMTHQGGESMTSAMTVLYITDRKPSGATTTSVVHLAPFRIFNGSLAYGMLDGSGQGWSVGQRFTYFSTSLSSADQVSVTLVDLTRSLVLWSSQLTAPAGTRPPIFLNTYAARNNIGTPLDAQTGSGFYIFAQIMDPDGDLNPSSVFATITYYYGTGSCATPIRMYDDGRISVTGDAVANDGLFTLFTNACTGNALSGMDGSIVLFNATDMKNHQTTTRMILHVVPGTGGGNNNGGGIGGSGRPPNLRWNGNQGYNLFNASQWDTFGYAATPTRNFKGGDTVVVVVGSLSLQNVYGIDQFTMLDPYSGNPAQSVVYGATKVIGPASLPSTNAAFGFFQFVNGYYIYTFRFKLNDPATVGTNFYTTPPQYPRYYYFASYPLSVLLTDSANNRFTTTDSINITADSGSLRTFPVVQTFVDAAYTRQTSFFHSIDTIYVQVRMLSVDSNTSMGNVFFGNVLIQDFAGGQELNRAPTNGIYSNLPICPPGGSCSTTSQAIWSSATTVSYRFAIKLARVNQDPWVAGSQNYALVLSSVKDSDESYASVTTQVVIQAPLYKMDLLVGNSPATKNAWGTKDYMYFEQDFNGFDTWKPLRVDYCAGTSTVSGIPGQGQGKCPQTTVVGVAYGDFWHDGTLGAAESIIAGTNAVVIYRHTVDATGAVVYLPVFFDYPANPTCTAITTGDVTGNGLPSVICGGSNGKVWYYANNGNWTQVVVDNPASGQSINSIVVGDFNGDGWKDIAVGGAGGYLRWYPNLGYGRFQNVGISDNWYATSEQTLNGTLTGSYLNTYVRDGLYEILTESLLNIPIQTGGTVNGAMNNAALNWTFTSAYNGATGLASATGGFPGAYAQVTAPFKASSVVAGYWSQPFTVSGSGPYTVALSLSYLLSTYGATGGGAVTFYAFVDPTNAAPPQTPSGCVASGSGPCWTSGPLTAVRGWTNATNFAITGRVTNPGTYYLKVAMYATYLSGGSNSVGGFDNVALTWSSTPGSTSALQEYWRIGPLPTRPGTAYTLNVYGHESGGSTPPDYDNFTVAYSTNVVGTDPTTGTYTTMFTVITGTDANYQYGLPATLGGATVWVRVLDTNRVVGATNLDSLSVDNLYINANTPSGTTGVTLTNVGDTSAVNTIDAQDANQDGFSDLVAGTANGRVFVYLGSGGGLILQGGAAWYSPLTSIVGVAWGNFSTAFPGLEIALSYGSTVQIIRGDAANSVIASGLPAFNPSSTITAFAVGDINGDGWDDVVVGTAAGGIFLWENLGQGTSWTYAVTVDSLGAQVYDLALGDTTNSQYVGR